MANYTITEHVLGQTYSNSMPSGATAMRMNFSPPPEGYDSFVGWNSKQDGTGTTYPTGQFTVTGNEERWAIFTRSILLDDNYSVVNGAWVVSAIDTVAATLPTLTRDGWHHVGWNTREDGTGTDYGFSYPAEMPNVFLYAQWVKWIDSLTIGEMNAIRVEDSSATEEDDEGDYIYATVPFTVKGAAHSTVSISASLTDQEGQYVDTFITDTGQTFSSATHKLTQTKTYSTTTTDGIHTGTFTLRASGVDTDKTHTLNVELTATNTSATQANVYASKGALISVAYFTIDLLGDANYGYAYSVSARTTLSDVWASSVTFYKLSNGEYIDVRTDDDVVQATYSGYSYIPGQGSTSYSEPRWYKRTQDTEITSGKTYYEAPPSGAVYSGGFYTVSNPVEEDLPTYYENITSSSPHDMGWYERSATKLGPRPGHGISFGAPAKTEGFHVAMDADFTEDATFLGDMNVGTGANVTQMLPYIVISNLAWTSANLASCSAAVANYRPCVARFSNGAVVEFDSDPQTDAYN